MRKILTLIPILLVILVGYVLRAPILSAWDNLLINYAACSRPIHYKIERLDPQFELTTEALKSALLEAEAVWEEPAGKNLFAYSDNGRLLINFTYDARQATTEHLTELGVTIESSRAAYDTLVTRYAELKTIYEAKRISLEKALAAYETRKQSYEESVAHWNSRGGAPAREYRALEAERSALNAELEHVRSLEAEVNDSVETLNSVADSLNRLAKELNISARTYNRIGEARGEEFEEGIYTRDSKGASITIYEFENQTKLIRVLAHEFGHALGLEHVEDSEAIMYAVNHGLEAKATNIDLAALENKCNAAR